MNLDLFSVPFFIGNIDLKRIKLEVEMGKSFISETPSSFNQENLLDPESEKYLMKVIVDLLGEKFTHFQIGLLKIWRNEYLNNDFQEPHVHINSKFSFILYEKVVTPHTIFYNPAKYLLDATFGNERTTYIERQFIPSVRKGQLILFPSFIEHMVNKNSDQVTISGNIDFKHMEVQQDPHNPNTESQQKET